MHVSLIDYTSMATTYRIDETHKHFSPHYKLVQTPAAGIVVSCAGI